jgi:hypothetical protein
MLSDNQVPVSGSIALEFQELGDTMFQTYFHNSGWYAYDYAVCCALRSHGGHVLTLARNGTVYGTLSTANKDETQRQVSNKDELRMDWGDLLMGWRLYCVVQLNSDATDLMISALARVQTYGPILDVVALF